MNKKTLLFLAFAFSTFLSSCKNEPLAYISNDIHDFKTAKLADTIKGKFIVKNTGNADLYLRNIAADCNCTIINFNRDTIGPDKEAVIPFKYTPTQKDKGKVEKKIILSTNTKKRLYVLKITGEIQ